MKLRALRKGDLDKACQGKCHCGCNKPFSSDNPLNIAAQCHFPTRCKVEYWDGVLTFWCGTCGKFICEIEVRE